MNTLKDLKVDDVYYTAVAIYARLKKFRKCEGYENMMKVLDRCLRSLLAYHYAMSDERKKVYDKMRGWYEHEKEISKKS